MTGQELNNNLYCVKWRAHMETVKLEAQYRAQNSTNFMACLFHFRAIPIFILNKNLNAKSHVPD